MTEHREITSAEEWDSLVEGACGHPLQEWGWGVLKEKTGPWEARRVAFWRDGALVGGCQVLVRRLPWPFRRIAYAPRGPFCVGDTPLSEVVELAASWCRETLSAVSLKIEPAVTADELALGPEWLPSEQVLLPNTVTIDLTLDEEAIFKGLHSKKARQYIRKADRSGVVVREATAADLPAILDIYHRTAEQDSFSLHPDEYYECAMAECSDVNQVFVAEIEGRALAFLWNATSSGTAFELWGGVSDEGKQLRANYLLKWRAILAAKERGARLYDLNGLLNDGVSRFKMLFVNEPTVWVGTFDRPLSPLYHAWNGALRLYRKLFK